MVLMPTQQQWLLIGGTGVAGAGIAYYVYEHNKKSKAAAQAAQNATSQFAYGYGAGGYGYGAQYQPEVYGYGLGYFAYGYGGGGGYPGGSAAGGGGSVITGANTTNAMWSQAAVNQLSNQGYTGSDVQAALGVYLTGGTLNSAQETIVQAAIAVEGYPPQSGPNGYPPAMNVGGTTGGGSGGGTTGDGTGSGSGVTGGSGGSGNFGYGYGSFGYSGTPVPTPPPPHQSTGGAISNLRVTSTSKSSFTVSWNATTAPQGYQYIVRDLATHTQVGGAHNTKSTSATVTGLKSGTDYNFGIQALPGGPGNNIHVRTQ